MKILDAFLFSEPHEDDLLYIKFKLQEGYIEEYIILENAYTFQGEYKGHHAEEVLKQDRFAPYRNKCHIISASELHHPGVNHEDQNFNRERWQRSLALQYIFEKYGQSQEQVRIIINDTDESIDFSDEARRKVFIDACERHPNEGVSFARLRYWYDFDNKCYIPNLRTPTIPLTLLVRQPELIWMARPLANRFTFYGSIDEPVGFEYSYVFRSYEDVCRKKHTYAHTGFTDDSVAVGLECNHWPRPAGRNEVLGNENYDFFEIVELTPENSPRYVRENLELYKCGIVPNDYQEKRVARYGGDTIAKWTANRG